MPMTNNASVAQPRRLDRLHTFVVRLSELLNTSPGEPSIIGQGRSLLKELVSHDDWLPSRFAEPGPDRYRQYLLHADSSERFSVVSFVWGPGQTTPIHDHTVWGLIGMLRGSEVEQHYVRTDGGRLEEQGEAHVLLPGDVDIVSPSVGDLHRVSNAYADRVSISIHVYGANIGNVTRSTYSLDGNSKQFVSGYSNTELPNFWNVTDEGDR